MRGKRGRRGGVCSRVVSVVLWELCILLMGICTGEASGVGGCEERTWAEIVLCTSDCNTQLFFSGLGEMTG